MKKETIQQHLEENSSKYIELLKNGKIRYSDFTSENLRELLGSGSIDPDTFPASLRGELMYRDLLSLDFKGLDIHTQLKLLLRDKWYGLRPEDIGEMLKDTWKAFSPDMLIRILKYHCTIYQNWPDWDWSAVDGAGTEAWCDLLSRHHCFADRCPEKIWKSFSPEESFDIAFNSPGLAARLDLNSLPLALQDLLLLERPELAGYFLVDGNEPPEKLFLRWDWENCYEKEYEAVLEFLNDLLPHLEESNDWQGEGFMGVFSGIRCDLFKTQFDDFLEKNYIPPTGVWLVREPLKAAVVPVNNLEAQILAHHPSLVGACMEEETLSRIDILLTPQFETLRQDMSSLVLLKAVSPELRRETLAALIEKGASENIIGLVKDACEFGKEFKCSAETEKLIQAVEDRKFDAFRNLKENVKADYMSVDKAREIFRNCDKTTVKNFFSHAITPMLRAYLITELDKEYSDERGALINIPLQTYWQEYSDDSFVEFIDDDDDWDDDDFMED